MFLDVHITENCNLKCKHCYLPKDREGKEMPFEMFKDIVDDYKYLDENKEKWGLVWRKNNPKKEGVILSGGEPTTHSRIIDFARYAKEKGFRISILSNGYRMIEVFEELEPILDKNDYFQLSVDGDKEMHDWMRGRGQYVKIESVLEFLQKKQKVRYGVHFTIHKGNRHCLEDMIALKYRYDLRGCGLNFYHDRQPTVLEPLTIKEYREVCEVATRWLPRANRKKCFDGAGCAGGILGSSVSVDGEYWICSRYQKALGKYPQKLSDVLDWEYVRENKRRDPKTTCMKGVK